MSEFDLAAQAKELLAIIKPSFAADAALLTSGAEWLHRELQDSAARPLYALAIGKAACPMARALSEILGARLQHGVLSAPSLDRVAELDFRWQIFRGGHPQPNEASLAAARAVCDLLQRAETERAVVICLISGGGSAALELPLTPDITLADLRQTHHALVNCGAPIGEINAVRRAFSAVKGGKLAALAPHADFLTLVVSDVNADAEYDVAAGPTLNPPAHAPDAGLVLLRYNLQQVLPVSVVRALERNDASDNANGLAGSSPVTVAGGRRRHLVLLDNRQALGLLAHAARRRGWLVETADDICEQPVADGAARLLERLWELCRCLLPGQVACLLSGGEFACPVRGTGQGGRNTETALRWVLALDEQRQYLAAQGLSMAGLSYGTDGADGNCPAAGAIVTENTLAQARTLQLDAAGFLARSDAYNWLHALGATIHTGPTGTNLRDVRILLARKNSDFDRN